MYVQDKIALITGGASGLGLIYAKEFLKHGLKGVTLADVDEVKGKDAAEDINKTYGRNKAIFVKLDVVDKTAFEDAMKKTVEAFGNFDILINNAGIMTDSIWEKEIDINLKGTINGCILALEEYLPKYNTSSDPLIVNISSVLGLDPMFFLPIYCATKHGVVALSKSFALNENAGSQKVRILTVCPGPTDTPLLHELVKKVYTTRHLPAITQMQQHMNEHPEIAQSPDFMGEAMVKIIENGENGSFWVAEAGKIHEVEVPNQKDLKILRTL